MDTITFTRSELETFAREHTTLTTARAFLANQSDSNANTLAKIAAAAQRGSVRTSKPAPTPEPVKVAKTNPWPGIYTIETERGHRTFKVIVNGEDSDFAQGKTVLAYLNGSDNEGDYKGFAFLVDGEARIWKRCQGNTSLVQDTATFMADPESALASKHCIRCNRRLTTPESITAGIGPECSKRQGGF